MNVTAEELCIDIARKLWDEHFEREQRGDVPLANLKGSCDEQVYQLELLRAKLAELTISVRAAGCKYEDLQRVLFGIIR